MFVIRITKDKWCSESDRKIVNWDSIKIDLPSTITVDCYLYNELASKPKITPTGVFFGEVFDNTLSPVNVELIHDQAVHSYLGDFLCFVFSEKNLSAYVSQGSRNRLFFTCNSKECIFSDSIEMVSKFAKLPLEINWDYMSHFVERGNISSTYTPFCKVFEVPVGCKLILNAEDFSFSIDAIWNPVDYIDIPFLEENWQEEFIRRIRWSLSQGIKKNIKTILLELSGGLDSSLLGCLLSEYREKNSIEISAINLYNKDDINSDERTFAKKVSDRFSIPIIYLETSDCLPFSADSENFFYKPNVPSNTFNYLAADIAVHQQASSIDKNYALANGHGGDSLFFSVPPMESVMDAIIQSDYAMAFKKFNELRRLFPNSYLQDFVGIIETFVRYATKRNLPLFKQITQCFWLKHGYRKRELYNYLHPIFNSLRSTRLPPGKAVQIENYYITIASCERQLPTLYPLLNQSVAASALAIPTYKSFDEYHNRIIVRRAFEKLAGSELPYRKNKGHATSVFFKGVRSNYKKIMELCMEGRSAKNGYIDTEKLHKDIKEMNQGIMEKAWYVTNLFCAEMFMNEWIGKS